MSRDDQDATLELRLHTPVQGKRAGAVARTLQAADRLYTLATLVDQPRYRERLARRCRFPAPTEPAARLAPAPPELLGLGTLLEAPDRLRLEEFTEEGECRFVLTGVTATVGMLRDVLGAVGDHAWLPDAPQERGAQATRARRWQEERLRRAVLSLDVAPWYRGCLLQLLHRALTDVTEAATSWCADGEPMIDGAADWAAAPRAAHPAAEPRAA